MNVTVLTTDGVGCCYLLYLCTSYVATALDADAPSKLWCSRYSTSSDASHPLFPGCALHRLLIRSNSLKRYYHSTTATTTAATPLPVLLPPPPPPSQPPPRRRLTTAATATFIVTAC